MPLLKFNRVQPLLAHRVRPGQKDVLASIFPLPPAHKKSETESGMDAAQAGIQIKNGCSSRVSGLHGKAPETERKSRFSMAGENHVFVSIGAQNTASRHRLLDEKRRLSDYKRIFMKPMMTGVRGIRHVQMMFLSFVHFLKFWSENMRELLNECLRSFSPPQMRTPDLAQSKIFLGENMRSSWSECLRLFSSPQMRIPDLAQSRIFPNENLRSSWSECLRLFSLPQMRTPELTHSRSFCREQLRKCSPDRSPGSQSAGLPALLRQQGSLISCAWAAKAFFALFRSVFCKGLGIVSVGKVGKNTLRRPKTEGLKRFASASAHTWNEKQAVRLPRAAACF